MQLLASDKHRKFVKEDQMFMILDGKKAGPMETGSVKTGSYGTDLYPHRASNSFDGSTCATTVKIPSYLLQNDQEMSNEINDTST